MKSNLCKLIRTFVIEYIITKYNNVDDIISTEKPFNTRYAVAIKNNALQMCSTKFKLFFDIFSNLENLNWQEVSNFELTSHLRCQFDFIVKDVRQ